MIKNKSGIWGEVYTARFLRDKGLEILASNFYTQYGEIDIIASDGRCVMFVEVKARNISAYIRAAEAVDFGKKQRLIKTANTFLKRTKLDLQPRFDVSEVYLNDDLSLSSINYIESAFGE